MKQPYDHNGNFASPYSEPRAKKALGVRLPESLDREVRAIAGDDLSAWLRGAIAAQLERDKSAQQERI